jgi:hypothetical protein
MSEIVVRSIAHAPFGARGPRTDSPEQTHLVAARDRPDGRSCNGHATFDGRAPIISSLTRLKGHFAGRYQCGSGKCL